jgi:hypothetical protein
LPLDISSENCFLWWILLLTASRKFGLSCKENYCILLIGFCWNQCYVVCESVDSIYLMRIADNRWLWSFYILFQSYCNFYTIIEFFFTILTLPSSVKGENMLVKDSRKYPFFVPQNISGNNFFPKKKFYNCIKIAIRLK